VTLCGDCAASVTGDELHSELATCDWRWIATQSTGTLLGDCCSILWEVVTV